MISHGTDFTTAASSSACDVSHVSLLNKVDSLFLDNSGGVLAVTSLLLGVKGVACLPGSSPDISWNAAVTACLVLAGALFERSRNSLEGGGSCFIEIVRSGAGACDLSSSGIESTSLTAHSMLVVITS